jgi:hypothetical protein
VPGHFFLGHLPKRILPRRFIRLQTIIQIMSDDKVNVESEAKVNSGEIEKPSSTEEVLSDSDAKIPTSTESQKSGNEADNVLLALAEDPAQNLFMDGKTKFKIV